MNRLANLLTVSRIAASAALLLTDPLSIPFFALYLWCGVSDMLDGPVARHTHAASPLGARLDSLADLSFAVALAWKLLPILPWRAWMLVWMGAIAAVRGASVAVSWVRLGRPVFLHTLLNKASGLALFALPVLYWLLGLPITAAALCTLTTVASVEELVLLATMKTLNRDVRGIFCAKSPTV